ncbi:MAG: hypothetical protein NT002_08440, partial [candidate division Zixibacteria bacterium]|nr:hypothetical protein [candidate division Zixibacteria bacterium]
AKIYVEYAGAIDELFVFLYAIKMQNDTKEAVFLDTLIHYNSQELNEFINATDFASGLVKCFGFLEPMKYSEFKGLSEDKVDILYRDTAANIVALRKQRETDRLRVIYNKLKHPFLVKGTLPPELGRHAEKVGVLLTPSDPQDIASAISIPVDNSNLKLIFNNIVMIGVTIENSLIITLDTFKYHLSGRN